MMLACQAAPSWPSPFLSLLCLFCLTAITSASLPTHETGNSVLKLIQNVEALAPGISLLSPSLLALHLPLTTKDVFQKTRWIGNLA